MKFQKNTLSNSWNYIIWTSQNKVQFNMAFLTIQFDISTLII